MAFNLQPNPDEADLHDRGAHAERADFSVSLEPVVAELGELGKITDADDQELPRSYFSETLCLMARDPHSLFAYWDIDWKTAFGEESPRQRKVHLRVLNADGSEQSSVEVEPLAGRCYVRVADADAAYQGEIGYFDLTGAWKAIRLSETVFVPPAMQGEDKPPDFATVPFHLSFQRMVDVLRIAEEDSESLTAMLSELRRRASSAEEIDALSAQQRELAAVIEDAAANEPRSKPQGSALPDLWTHYSLEKIFGFGNSSLNGGFGGSSRGYPPPR